MSVEDEFRSLVEHFQSQGVSNLQYHFAHLDPEDVPEQFRSAFDFWASLAGPSRNLLLDVSQGRRLRKTHG